MEASLTQKKGLCSIEIGPNGIAVAYTTDTAKPEITICEFRPYQNQNNTQLDYEQLKDCLIKIVADHDLKKSNCNWVLHPDYYRLTLINTPNVPLAEYKKAVRWQIKDIINYPIEDATIDIFYPDEMERTLKKIYVIAAQNSFLQRIVNIIQDCELYPIAVDIREFAIRNLATNLSTQNKETSCLLNITKESCLVVLIKQQNIQFVRRIPVGSDLATELQRSFNYCQTELNQELPTKFFMLPSADFEQNTVQNIAKNLEKEILIFDLQKTAHFQTPIDQRIESDCWAAVGGALRNTM